MRSSQVSLWTLVKKYRVGLFAVAFFLAMIGGSFWHHAAEENQLETEVQRLQSRVLAQLTDERVLRTQLKTLVNLFNDAEKKRHIILDERLQIEKEKNVLEKYKDEMEKKHQQLEKEKADLQQEAEKRRLALEQAQQERHTCPPQNECSSSSSSSSSSRIRQIAPFPNSNSVQSSRFEESKKVLESSPAVS